MLPVRTVAVPSRINKDFELPVGYFEPVHPVVAERDRLTAIRPDEKCADHSARDQRSRDERTQREAVRARSAMTVGIVFAVALVAVVIAAIVLGAGSFFLRRPS